MQKIFITYGDDGFEATKRRIIMEAQNTHQFDKVIDYGPEDISQELRDSSIFREKRGGGLWSWKPDVILHTMETMTNGDFLVYCDSGCTIQSSREWERYWNILSEYEIIAQRFYQSTDKWTRREIIDFFSTNADKWTKCYQCEATVVLLRVSDFTKRFIQEWRGLMIYNSNLARDVSEKEREQQYPGFIENRHDQALYSALIYKYLSDNNTRHKIFIEWERTEDLDIIYKQAVRATRLRHCEQETRAQKTKRIVKRVIKSYILKTLYYIPRQWWYSRRFRE